MVEFDPVSYKYVAGALALLWVVIVYDTVHHVDGILLGQHYLVSFVILLKPPVLFISGGKPKVRKRKKNENEIFG